MEETATPPAPAPPPPHPAAMDVVAPHSPAPVAVQPAPPAEAAGSKDKPPLPPEVPKSKNASKDKIQKPAFPKKPTRKGVSTAIFATVIIVLGLAAMATYAYIKTKN